VYALLLSGQAPFPLRAARSGLKMGLLPADAVVP
jgi:hypothetical protein